MIEGVANTVISPMRNIVPLNRIEYGVYGDLILIYPKPYSVYLGD